MERFSPTVDQPEWRALEILVAKIQARLAPTAKVEHNVRVIGKSGLQRQVDVLVRQNVGQYLMTIAVDCKDYAGLVDIGEVEAFHGIVDDIGAQAGALVAPKGFTAGAKARAKTLNISLYSPIDTDPHKWQVHADARIVIAHSKPLVAFGFATSTTEQFVLPYDFWNLQVRNEAGDALGTPMQTVVRRWNNGEFPSEAGEHPNIRLFDEEIIVDIGEERAIKAVFTVNIKVVMEFYYGRVGIDQIYGFKDQIKGGVIAREFTTAWLDIEEILRTWQQIASADDAPEPALMVLYTSSYPNEIPATDLTRSKPAAG